MGTPPATLASKATARPCCRARVEHLGARAGPTAPCWPSPRPCPPPTATTPLAWPNPCRRPVPRRPGRSDRAARIVHPSSPFRAATRSAVFVRIADDDAAQHERPARSDGQTFALFPQQARHAAAYGAAANQGDAKGFVHWSQISLTNPWIPGLPNAGVCRRRSLCSMPRQSHCWFMVSAL